MENRELDKDLLKELNKKTAEEKIIKEELQREKNNTIKNMFDKWSDEIYKYKYDNKPVPIKKSRFAKIKERFKQILRLG